MYNKIHLRKISLHLEILRSFDAYLYSKLIELSIMFYGRTFLYPCNRFTESVTVMKGNERFLTVFPTKYAQKFRSPKTIPSCS